MSENRQVIIPVVAQADTSGMEVMKRSGQDMAQSLEQSGQKAGAGLEAGIVGAVKRATEAAQESTKKLSDWQKFLKGNMQQAMSDFGGHAGAMTALSAQWRSMSAEQQKAAAAAAMASRQVSAATSSVGESAKQAAAGVAVLTAEQSRLLSSLSRQATIAGQGKSAWLELRAAQLGVTEQAAGYIARIRQAEQAQNALGMSAKQTAFALRGVPAQFTDIVTSLASGQRPMQVLLQQGGQLKDMFGGIGPAARALGGYIAGLVNPFTVTAAAVAVLGVELAHTESRLRQLNSVQALLTGTGRGDIFPTANLKEFISELSKAPGVTREVATQIVSEFAKAHEIGGGLFKDLSRLAADYARATGTDIPAAAKTLAKAFSDPAEGAKTLEGALGTLTSSQILAIERLTRLGDVAGAQRLLFDALNGSLKGLATDSMTPLQRSVNDLGNAWDKLQTSMEQSQGLRTINELLAKAVTGAANLISAADKIPPWMLLAIPGGGLPAYLARTSGPKFKGNGATGSFDAPTTPASGASAASDDEIKRALEAAKAYRSQAGQIAELKEKRTAFNKALTESIALYGKDADQTKRLRDAVAGINEQIAKQAGQGANEVAGLKAKRQALDDEIKQLQAEQERLLGGDSRKDRQTEGERQLLKLRQELAVATTSVARSEKERAIAVQEVIVQRERLRDQEKRINDDLRDSLDTRRKNIDAINDQASKIREAAIAQEAANASTGKSKTAIEEETLAKFKSAAADKVLADLDPDRHKAMLQRIADQERYVAALQKSEAQQIKQRQDEGLRVAQEEGQTLQLELSLLGRSQQEREKIIAKRKVELELAKEIAEIDRSGASDADKEARREQARSTARIKSANAEQKTILDEWQRTADSINQSLTDALLRGFESGKDFASNFRDTLKNMFQTLVLRPVIQAVMAPVSGALAGIGQQIGGSIIGGGGSVLGSALGLGNIFGGGSLLQSAGSGLAGMFGFPDIGSFANTLGFGAGANAFGLGGAAAGMSGAAEAVAMEATLTGGGTGAGMLAGLGTAMPWIGAGLLAASLFGGNRGGPKTESGFGPGVPLRGDPSSSRAIADAITAQYKAIAGRAAKDLQLGVFTATDPQGTAQTQFALEAFINGRKISSRGDRLGGVENVGRSPEALAAAVTEETERVVIAALQETNLPGKIGEYLRQLGDVDKLSGGSLQAAVQKVQKALTERQALEQQYFDLTHTDLERLTATRQKERDALDDTNRELYDQVALMADLKTAAASAAQAVTDARSALVDAYQRESDSLRGVVERHTGYAQQLRELRDSLTLSQAPMSRAARTARAGSVFEGTLSSAIAGNEDALKGLGGAGTTFIDAVQSSARSPAELAAAVAKVQAGLTSAAASAEGRATTAQQQLDAMTQQLSALGVLNTSVQSVGEALGNYLGAVAANTRAQAEISAAILQYQQAQAVQANTPPPPQPELPPAGAIPTFLDILKQRFGGWSGLVAAGSGMGESDHFASGGLASGVASVGERGPEIVDFQTPGRVYTNEQTRGMFASNAALAPLLEKVCRLLENSRDEQRREAVAMITPLAKMDSRLKKFDADGMPPVRV